jgi:hypothetical protein
MRETSASRHYSRLDGFPEPAISPARPVSMNCRFQLLTDCSGTFACRSLRIRQLTACTASSMRTYSSGGNAVAWAMINSFKVETKVSTPTRKS